MLRQLFILTFSVIFLGNMLFAHEKHVHQYIVREAWKLVTYQNPEYKYCDLNAHIGYNETGSAPWKAGPGAATWSSCQQMFLSLSGLLGWSNRT